MYKAPVQAWLPPVRRGMPVRARQYRASVGRECHSDAPTCWGAADFQTRWRGAQHNAYPPVIAGGPDATTIHYSRKDKVLPGAQQACRLSSVCTVQVCVSACLTASRLACWHSLTFLSPCPHVHGQLMLSGRQLHVATALAAERHSSEPSLDKPAAYAGGACRPAHAHGCRLRAVRLRVGRHAHLAGVWPLQQPPASCVRDGACCAQVSIFAVPVPKQALL